MPPKPTLTSEARTAARVANLKKPRHRKPGKAFAVGDRLKSHKRSYGIVGVRKMVVGAIQQQVEAMRDRFLGEADRMYLLEALKALAIVEKVAKQPNNSAGGMAKTADGTGVGVGGAAQLPALETKA